MHPIILQTKSKLVGILTTESDPNTSYTRVWVLRFARKEGKRRVGAYLAGALVDGKGPGEGAADGAASRPVVAGSAGEMREVEKKWKKTYPV